MPFAIYRVMLGLAIISTCSSAVHGGKAWFLTEESDTVSDTCLLQSDQQTHARASHHQPCGSTVHCQTKTFFAVHHGKIWFLTEESDTEWVIHAFCNRINRLTLGLAIISHVVPWCISKPKLFCNASWEDINSYWGVWYKWYMPFAIGSTDSCSG